MKGCVFMDFFGAVSLFLSLLILCGGIFFTLYLKGFFFIHPIRTLHEMFKRKEKGLTQKDLADMLGVKRMTIYNYEAGIRKPSIDRLKKIAGILECDITEII